MLRQGHVRKERKSVTVVGSAIIISKSEGEDSKTISI
jgi:hypothetical protein